MGLRSLPDLPVALLRRSEQGQLELQGQKLQSHEWTPYRFELKGPVLSYYEGTKKLGAIHFEDPNTNVEVKEEEPDKFEVLYHAWPASLQSGFQYSRELFEGARSVHCS